VITELIGSGGMGTVYKAKHQLTHQLAAIKILSKELTKQPESMKRFINEAKSASRINHTNVVSVSNCGLYEEQGIAYLIMEYLDGNSLSKYLSGKQKLSIERSLKIFIQLCAGIARAHGSGIVHRDIKPSNVILIRDETESDLVKVIDFGIAKARAVDGATVLETLTNTSDIIGSPKYMSPEQFNNQGATHCSDIYSIGCLMYQTLTGEVPFNTDNPVALMTLHTTAQPPSLVLNDEDPIIVHKLDEIIYKCLQKDPEQRFASTDELREELENVQAKLQKLSLKKKRLSVGSGIANIRLAFTQAQRKLLAKLGITSGKESKFRIFALSGLGIIATLLVAFVLAVNLVLSTYIPQSDARILKQGIDIRPLICRQTKPPSIDLSTFTQLSLAGGEKLTRQYAQARKFRNAGDLNAAIIGYLDAINCAASLDLLHAEIGAQITSELSLCYLFIGNLTSAREYSEKALATFKDLGYYDRIKSLLASLVRARALMLLKEDSTAKEEFQHMQATLRGADIKRRFDQVAYSESFLADFLRQNNEFDLAASYYKAAEEHWAGFQADGDYNRAAVLDQLGMLWSSKGKQDLAKESLEKAISALQSSPDKTKLAQAKLSYHLSQIKWSQHDFVSAIMENMEAKQLLKQ